MLDVIADFWKPVKKGQGSDQLNADQLQTGCTIGFGFVPQAILNGRRLDVSAINTYQFGDEALTSFVLSQEAEPDVSMIIAESEGEQYLAISRRISINDRIKLFDTHDLENIMTKADITKLPCKDNLPEYKGWLVVSYKREIHGLKGRIFKGDFRKGNVPSVGEAQEFEYTLLVSDSNEHAIEIEKYGDARLEVYATVYRRMNDVGEITYPDGGGELSARRNSLKLTAEMEQKPAPILAAPAPAAPVVAVKPAEPTPVVVPMNKAPEEAKPSPITLREFNPASLPTNAEIKLAPVLPEPKPQPQQQPQVAAKPPIPPAPPVPVAAEKKENNPEPLKNGATTMSTATAEKPKLFVQPTAPTYKQEIKTVTTNGAANNFDSDAIECELRVANKIIDEAIRNEMRLTDIVRRIIELPVANQEAVQIPVTLSDEDYALLAIRYSISSSDRNAIKRRIIEDLNDFSGGAKK